MGHFGPGGVCILMAGVALATPVGAEMTLNGTVATENHLGLRDGEFFNFRNANLFQLRVTAHPADQVATFANLELRNTNFTRVESIDDLWDRNLAEPVGWRVNEAYVDLYGFLIDSDAAILDLRAGKQKLAWGEADGFNPTNGFDPYDLENPLDMKERLGNVALKATLTVGDELFMVEGVVAPRFLPSVLPVELFLGDNPLDSPLMPDVPPEMMQMLADLDMDLVPPGLEQIRVATPAWRASEVQAGARVRWAMLGFDWTVSYFHGRETIPVPRSTTASIASTVEDGCIPGGRPNCLVIAGVDLVYPRVDVVGFNLRGGIGDVGVWGEAAVIFPEQVIAETRLDSGLPVGSLTAIEDEPFTKWTLGAEYTFEGGYFINLQWVHGFFTELTGHDLHDYLFLVLRKSFLSDRLKFELSLGGELDTGEGRHALGGLLSAEMSYKPFDGSEVVLGYVMARGQDGASFELFEPLDQLYLRIQADF